MKANSKKRKFERGTDELASDEGFVKKAQPQANADQRSRGLAKKAGLRKTIILIESFGCNM